METLILIISVIVFCVAIAREERRRRSKLDANRDTTRDLTNNSTTTLNNDGEYQLMKRKLREKDDIINKLKGEYSDTNLKMETYLSLTKASQELILRNDERVRTVSKLWEEKAQQLEKQVSDLGAEVSQLRRQLEKADDELNSHQHQVNNLSRLLAEKECRIQDLESDLEQLAEIEEMFKKKTQRIQQLEGDLEHMEEIRRKEADKLRAVIRDKDSVIEQLESVCREMKLLK